MCARRIVSRMSWHRAMAMIAISEGMPNHTSLDTRREIAPCHDFSNQLYDRAATQEKLPVDFNPLAKPFDSIDLRDIERLRNVPEGWYVEYKSQPILARDAAKSLAAFANHFGGWLIFGVQAAQ